MYTHEFKFRNGDEVKDIITGFSGTITGIAFYITGCNQYLIMPKVADDNKKVNGEWIDEDRILMIMEQKIDSSDVSNPDKNPGADMVAPGGNRDTDNRAPQPE